YLWERIGPLRILVAGIMGRTAAEESGFPHERGEHAPSVVLRDLESVCEPFLLNHAKTPESGRIFGEIVARRLGGEGLVHVECRDRTIYCWDRGPSALAEYLSLHLGFPLKEVRTGEGEGDETRVIRGCLPGEPVFVNGTIIGTATGTSVVLTSRDGALVPLEGLREKPHGLEKLTRQGPIDISTAWCKSGNVRKGRPKKAGKIRETGRIAVVDHAGHRLYEALGGDICGVLSIGDDTTAVCGHICSHLGIPVFGVVDGDFDGIIEPVFPEGSVVVEVMRGRDDEVGVELASLAGGSGIHWPSWVKQVLEKLGDVARVVVDRQDLHT
ncbi:MAG: DUF2117 domain-containing protein, partial [Methanomicrobiaceae archaeon]|nr:DUF2117 domain-containing protein [Methanomicrobiaceae archaeon]